MPLSHLRRPLFLALAAYMAALAFLHARGFFAVRVPDAALDLRDQPEAALEGRAVSPRREDGRGVKFVLDEASSNGVSAGAKALVYLPRGAPGLDEVLPGRRIRLLGRLRLPRRPRNPGEFDERGFLSDRGIGWVMQARELGILDGKVPPRFWLSHAAERLRLSMQAFFERRLELTQARLLTGLTLGYKGPLPRELNRAIQDAGAMHLLVPSGAKVAFVLLIVAWLCARLTLPVGARLAAAGVCGGFYTLMVGADPPYARAYLGALALGLGAIADRESGAFQALVLSAWLILLAEPRALFSAGFQMTYAAMAGLLLAMPQIDAALPPSWPAVLRSSACVLAVTVIVQAMLWPIFAATFGRAALLGACANLVLVPLSGVILGAGFFFWITGIGTPAVSCLLNIFVWVCRHASALPYAAVDLLPMSNGQVLAYYLLAAGLLILPRKKEAAVLAGAAVLTIGTSAAAARFRTTPLEACYLSLHNQRAAIVFHRGKAILVSDKAATAPVLKALHALGRSRFDRTVDLDREPGFSACEGAVCFLFAPPRVRRGKEEFSIIASRLKHSAVEAITDGSRIETQDPRGGALH